MSDSSSYYSASSENLDEGDIGSSSPGSPMAHPISPEILPPEGSVAEILPEPEGYVAVAEILPVAVAAHPTTLVILPEPEGSAVAVDADSSTPTLLPEGSFAIEVAADSPTRARPWRRALLGLFHFGVGVMQCGGALLGQAFIQTERMFMSFAGIIAILMFVASSMSTVLRPWFDGEPASWTDHCLGLLFTFIGLLVPLCAVLVTTYIIRFVVLIVILVVTLMGTGLIAGLLSREHLLKVLVAYCLWAVIFFVIVFLLSKAVIALG